MEREKDFLGGDVSNAAEVVLDLQFPYRVEVECTGTSDLLMHRYQADEVEAKGKAAKNSAAKKTDNVESYVFRLPNGNLAIPGVYLVGALVNPKNGAAKYRQDPRSPRKSALDLFKAAIQPLTVLADLGTADWGYLDRRRAVIQGNAITRVRPAILAGWRATWELQCTFPEYIAPMDLLDALSLAGRAVGLADFRPTYGRFSVTKFTVVQD